MCSSSHRLVALSAVPDRAEESVPAASAGTAEGIFHVKKKIFFFFTQIFQYM